MPTKKEAWDALGHVYWKKSDLEQSAKCFESSLEQDDKNIEILKRIACKIDDNLKILSGN